MVDNMVEATSGSGHWLDGHSVFVQYLIVRNDNNRLTPLSLTTDAGDSLPVFSSEVAAHAFMRSNHFGEEGWHVRESTAGELISLLMGHIADVNLVTLNPPGGTNGESVTPETIDKRDFIGSLMREPILLSHN
jgi:hypothetical protein